MAVSIAELMAKPFEDRSQDEQLNIILRGKPRPKKFNAEKFDKEQWLTACDVENNFFCWPCVLFARDSYSLWCTSGVTENLINSMGLHKGTQPHINAVFTLQKFLSENLVPVDASSSNKLDSNAKKNREIVKRIMDVVCHAASMKPPVRNKSNNYDQIVVADCIECLNLLKAYDLHEHCDEAIKLIKQRPALMKNVVSTLSFLVTQEIKKEVQASTHASLILSEHSDVDLESKLSNVIRYVKGDKVYERFLGFSKVLAFKSSSFLEKHITTVLKKLDLSNEKLLALSCDGAVATQGQLKELVKSFRTEHGCCAFVPSYNHDFDFLLEQSLSVFLECRFFFQNLRCMKSFLQNSQKIRGEFNLFISDAIPNLCDFNLSNSNFLRVLKVHRRQFISFFHSIVEKFVEYTEDDVARATGFSIVLESTQTIFLLELFYTLFGHTAIFTETLRSSCPENVFDESIIKNIKTTIRQMKEEGFQTIWNLSISKTPDEVNLSEDTNSRLTYYQLFFKIMDHIDVEVDIRLNSLEKLNILHILTSGKDSGMYSLYDEQLENLKALLGKDFDDATLKSEIQVINSKNEMLVKDSTYKLLETLESKNLGNIFKNVKKLAIFILTLPCKPIPSSDSVSKFDLIKSWASVCGCDLEDISLLAIESELLARVTSQDRFNEIMYVFQTQNTTLKVS